MERHSAVALLASSALTAGLALMAHEFAHVLAGWLAGGSPKLVTATEVRGNFAALSPAGYVALGASGSLVNVLLCGLGWWVLHRRPTAPDLELAAWFFFAVNGMLVTTKLIGEAVAGFGDLMTVLRPLSSTTYPRVVVAGLGTLGVIWMVRRSGQALARLLPPGDPTRRVAEARRIVLIGAGASAIVVLGGSVASPVGMLRGSLLGLGVGLGPFIPLLFAVRFVRDTTLHRTGTLQTGSRAVVLAACTTTVAMWFVVGPGIELAN